MLAMPEKSFPQSRSLLTVTAFAMFFLTVSSFFLFHSANDPPIPSTNFNLVDGENEIIDSLLVPSPTSTNAHEPEKKNLDSDEKKNIDSDEKKNLDSDEKDETSLVENKGCDSSNALLRIYMYDLNPKFHFGLLEWKPEGNETWPDVSDPSKIPRYPGGLNAQHSIEYWLTLDLLSSNVKGVVRPCSVIRVANPSEADFIFVPFFASLSYNRYSKVQGNQKVSLNQKLQKQLVQFLLSQPEWKKFGGKDHIIVPHHPNSLLYGRKKLHSSRFVLADFGRYDPKIANIDKDIIAPYKHVVRSISAESSAVFEQRPTLMYFQGAIYRKDGGTIRQELYYLLKDEDDVHFTFGSVIRSGARQASQGMGSSKFCLNIAGDTPSSNRLFDAIVSHCVPVIISDHIELPYEDVLDYSEFSIFVRAQDAVKPKFLLKLLRNINREEWTKMWERLKEVSHHFEYQYPSQLGDAVEMIWQALSQKVNAPKMIQKGRIYRTPEFLKQD